MTPFRMLRATLLALVCVSEASTNLPPNILSQLKLSPNARVHLRNEPGYATAVKRWQYWRAPDFAIIIDVANENDVSEAVRFANSHHIPFLAQSGAHGGTSALGNLEDGMQIRLRGLNSMQVSEDGTYVTVGGGIKGVELRDGLWKSNKWTVSGMCECPGHLAVALGGGVGILQGRYGLASDQIIALNVVLANGTAINVSRYSHPDLFWAMRGAGHNFGIVTSMDYRIYDVPDDGEVWSHQVLTYEATPANVRKVFSIGKDMLKHDSQPDGMMIMGVITSSPDSDGKVVIEQHGEYHLPSQPIYFIPYHRATIADYSTSCPQFPLLHSTPPHPTVPRPLSPHHLLAPRHLPRNTTLVRSPRLKHSIRSRTSYVKSSLSALSRQHAHVRSRRLGRRGGPVY